VYDDSTTSAIAGTPAPSDDKGIDPLATPVVTTDPTATDAPSNPPIQLLPALPVAATATATTPVQIWTNADKALQSGPVFAASDALVSHLLRNRLLHMLEVHVTCALWMLLHCR
jgi:hypothetical protein